MTFIPGLKLSRALFEEQIEPLLAKHHPDLKYAAASHGMCSESLGLDDEISMDHMWGPQVVIYLSQRDHEKYGTELNKLFHVELPETFMGFQATWQDPAVDIQETSNKILYNIIVATVRDSLRFNGINVPLPLKDVDWLEVSEQHLLEFTNGEVFRDDIGEFTEARKALKYYPDHVLRLLLQREWNMVGSNCFPIGRIGFRGDELGLRLQAAKVVGILMRLAFMVSRQYYTYHKWFGLLFKRLPIAARLEPFLTRILTENDWRRVEELIWEASTTIIRTQNELGITDEISPEVKRDTTGRHHLDVDYWEIGSKTAGQLPGSLKRLVDSERYWADDRQHILQNEEVGKWLLLLQKD